MKYSGMPAAHIAIADIKRNKFQLAEFCEDGNTGYLLKQNKANSWCFFVTELLLHYEKDV